MQENKEYQGRKMNYGLVATMIGVLGAILLLAIFCFNYGKGAKAANFTVTYNNNSFISKVTYDENEWYANDYYGIKLTIKSAYSSGTQYYLYYDIEYTQGVNTNVTGASNKVIYDMKINSPSFNSSGTYYATYPTYSVRSFSAIEYFYTYNDGSGTGGSSTITMRISDQYYFLTDGNTYNSTIDNWYVTTPPSSGGGYTQADLDAAYYDGELHALNTASASQYGSGTTYSVYTDGNMQNEAGNIFENGQLDALNEVSSSTNGSGTTWNAYSTTNAGLEANRIYKKGELQALNDASSGTYGTGTTYTTYSIPNMNSEMLNSYAKGIADTTNALAESATGDTNTYGYPYTSGLILDPTIWPDKFSFALYQQSHAWGQGRLYVLNRVSNNYAGGTETTYTSYSDNSLNTEISGIQQNAYNLGEQNSSLYAQGRIYVLNEVASSPGGTGTTYTDYSSNSLDTETASIYRAGELLGIEETNSPKELTKFLPRLLAGIGGAIYPILTYEVFGISIMNFIILFLGLGLLYIVLKFVL